MEDFERMKMLIVEDDEFSRTLLSEYFEKSFDITTATDGQQAIEIINKNLSDFAVILLDVIMPNVNGMYVLEYMNAANMMNDVPVIMITADSTKGREARAFELGASDFIYKPYNLPVVGKRVMNIVNLHYANRKLKELLKEEFSKLIEE